MARPVGGGGRSQLTTIELSISGGALAFGAPQLLERFRDLAGFVPPAGSLRLVRLSSEAVVLAWTGVDAGRYVVRASPVSLRRGAWAPVVISGGGPAGGQAGAGVPATGGPTGADRPPAPDAVLADVAAGPDAEAFALWRAGPSSAHGGRADLDPRRWAIRAARGHYAGHGEVSFAAPELVAAPGPYGPPAVAVDPASGRALAAWVTLAGGGSEGSIEYSLRAAEPPSTPPPAAVASTAHTARRVGGHGGTSLVVSLTVLAAFAFAGAGALLLGLLRRPGHLRARRG